MRRFMISALAAGLLIGTSAFAQDHHDQGVPHGGGVPLHMGGAPHGGMSRGMENPHGGGMTGTPRSFGEHRSFHENGRGVGAWTTLETRHGLAGHESMHGTSGAMVHYGHDSRGFGMRPSNWNNRPHHFNRGDYRRNFSAPHRFHYGSYHRPAGWYYRRWAYGEYLPRMFWVEPYWIDDWWLFDLPIPPYGYEWVRYGDDALLINIYTGEILEVEYDVFY